jgi:hypothetical protein
LKIAYLQLLTTTDLDASLLVPLRECPDEDFQRGLAAAVNASGSRSPRFPFEQLTDLAFTN